MNSYRIQSGFTLIEMMVTVSVLVILMTVGIPSMKTLIDNNRLKGAAESVMSELYFAKSEAIKRNAGARVSFTTNGSTTWCYGVTTKASCDCSVTDVTNANACTINNSGTNVLKRGGSTDYADISLPRDPVGTFDIAFDQVRGKANTDSIKFESPGGKRLEVRVSVLGRVRICTPTGTTKVPGYPTC